MMEAAQFSVNTYFVQLELATGMCRVTKMAKKMGIKIGHRIGEPSVDVVDRYQSIPSFTLGTAEVSPMSMAEAYATVAARGIHCNPIIVSKITTRTGKNLQIPDARCRRVMDRDVADGVNKVLRSVVERGTGRKARVFGEGPIAGKTGTINSNEAVWFAGYTPEIAGVSMISIDNTKSPFIKSRKLRKKGDYFRGQGVHRYTVPSTHQYLEGSGSADAGKKIWKPVMQEYLKKVPNTSFTEPPRRIQVGREVTVPSIAGLGIGAAIRRFERAGFTVETQFLYSDTVPQFGFIGWSPSPGQSVAEFGTIYLQRSKGKDPAVAEAQKKAQDEAKQKKADDRKKRREERKRKHPGHR